MKPWRRIKDAAYSAVALTAIVITVIIEEYRARNP